MQPLGSHAGKNKLLMVYYTLGNIDPKYRSKLSAIRLLAIAKSSDLSRYTVDVILDRIKKDLDVLYQGVKIQTAVGERTIYGAVISLCGDTLAQHEFAGFKEGVGFALCKCRHCDCTAEDMQTNFDEKYFNKRTVEGHLRQCSDIEKASTDLVRNHLKTTYGINRRSSLVDFPGFNLIEQTPQDIMHIILEGIAPMEIKCVLNHLILSGQIDLDTFNSAMYCFPYSPLDLRDRPCPITASTLSSNDNRLKQSSGQMLVLLKILPFLLNNVKDSEFVQFIIELVEITQILLAPVISLHTIAQLFPEKNIIPKQHYLLHMPSQIAALGPMVRHMCMRFESKHRFFKRWAAKLNFKNICKTLIQHNQRFECSQNVSGNQHPIFTKDRELGPVSEASNIEYIRSKLRDSFGIDVQTAVSLKWLTLNSNKYMSHKSLIISGFDGQIPRFSLIRDIWKIKKKFFFEIQPYETVAFRKDLHCYEVVIPNLAQANEVIDEDIVDFTAYHIVPFQGQDRKSVV